MLISVLGFGSIWTRRFGRDGRGDAVFDPRGVAYYNTTGVAVRGNIRNRPRIYGVARFNGTGGFRPECLYRMLYKVFDCEAPCIWNGHAKVLFKTLLRRPERPDAYSVIVTSEQTGEIATDREWLSSDATVISFSEFAGEHEVMVVMPAHGWIRGALGTFFLEPAAQRPWEARLVLSTAG